MTNLEIIGSAMMMNGIKEDVDTYAGWSRRGYQVQKGSKALFKTCIWKPVTGKSSAQASAEPDGDAEVGRMIMVCAAFFGRSQVERKTESK